MDAAIWNIQLDMHFKASQNRQIPIKRNVLIWTTHSKYANAHHIDRFIAINILADMFYLTFAYLIRCYDVTYSHKKRYPRSWSPNIFLFECSS